MTQLFLTLNAGSSSIKFSIYEKGEPLVERAKGQVENLGRDARLVLKSLDQDAAPRDKDPVKLGPADHMAALKAIFEHSAELLGGATVAAIGHRIVHGGIDFTGPAVLDEPTIKKLQELEPLAPLHQPHNLKVVEAARRGFPEAMQVGCFDTAFHRGHAFVNDTFALPRHYYDKGVRRYGFHGLSYEYITGELARREPQLYAGLVVIAHLGNGASMCAIRNGHSVASTMGFSALDGLPMGTRCGQLDPGVVLYLLDNEGMTSHDISQLLYQESGLKGLSGMTHDVRVLTASSATEARQALDYYACRVKREIGALAASLGGIDALVFCGGIGENSAFMRQHICQNLDWMGIAVDHERNAQNAYDISLGPKPVLVLPTDEECVIARALQTFLDERQLPSP